MSVPFAPPVDGGSVATQMWEPPSPYADSITPPPPSSSIIIVFIVIASALIVSAAIYLLLRFISRHLHGGDVVLRSESSDRPQQCHVAASGLLDSLPVFTFRSVTGRNLGGGDCAVCLSKFEGDDLLRLLPLCCHAFHASCIDTWIASNQTCPLCRSTVLPSDADFDKIISADNRHTLRSGSFRIEIGSISRRSGGGGAPEAAEGERRRSYSIGSFDYIVDDNGYEIPVGSTTNQRVPSDFTAVDKESSIGITVPEPPGEVLAAEVSGGRNWLREYMDRLGSSVSISSRAMSFRSSGRFFSGSSRRSDLAATATAEDLEASRVGEEISELFRWLSNM